MGRTRDPRARQARSGRLEGRRGRGKESRMKWEIEFGHEGEVGCTVYPGSEMHKCFETASGQAVLRLQDSLLPSTMRRLLCSRPCCTSESVSSHTCISSDAVTENGPRHMIRYTPRLSPLRYVFALLRRCPVDTLQGYSILSPVVTVLHCCRRSSTLLASR